MAFDIEKIVALVPGNVYWKDKDGRFLGCNNNHAAVVNLKSPSDIVGLTSFDLADEKLAAAVVENDKKVMLSKKEYVFEERGTNQDGESAVYLSQKIPLFDNDSGEVVGIMGISIDISIRKRYEEELRKLKEKAEIANKAKSDFILNISHDLRTPMTGILGFTEILQLNETDEEKKEMLGFLESSGNVLLKLLNEIVSAVEVEENDRVDSETFNIRELIDDNLQLMRPAIEKKGLNYIVEIDESIPYNLIGDRRRIVQILNNLVGNAIKFTEKGYIKVAAKVCSNNNKKKVVVDLMVEDTGIGIEENRFKDIFDKFSHLSPHYKEKYPGAGLGLWMVKKFINDLGGTIQVTSKIGDGAVFTCRISFQKK